MTFKILKICESTFFFPQLQLAQRIAIKAYTQRIRLAESLYLHTALGESPRTPWTQSKQCGNAPPQKHCGLPCRILHFNFLSLTPFALHCASCLTECY